MTTDRALGLRITDDAFLSEVFGRDVFRTDVGDGGDFASAEDVTRRLRSPSLAYCKVPANDLEAVNYLEDVGFRLVDTAITLGKGPDSPSKWDGAKDIEIRFATDSDAEGISALAGRAFRYSRFHADPKISKELADRCKREWAGNFFKGQRGDYMVVAAVGDGIVGFNQVLRRPDDGLVIDLIAVDESVRGRRLAEGMTAFAEENCPFNGHVLVGTQTANVPSLRAYIRMGFLPVGVQYVLHAHGQAT